MKLIRADTLANHEFADVDNAPPYAILSHRWGTEECTYQMWMRPHAEIVGRKGYQKIRMSCNQALKDGYSWIWVDSCCIDKSSSAELSEAINSMYRWYGKAEVCYAHLDDITGKENMQNSLWFTRGWTLQELLAPSRVVFFDAEWTRLGFKSEMINKLGQITRISNEVLSSGMVQTASIAVRLSWAAQRQTTRVEDMAYCLLGICQVNMPLLYGEGRKSFIRLQEEILRTTRDYSLLLWELKFQVRTVQEFLKDARDDTAASLGLLVDRPSFYRLQGNTIAVPQWKVKLNPVVVAGGIEITLPMSSFGSQEHLLAALPYTIASRADSYLCMVLRPNDDESYSRYEELVLVKVSEHIVCEVGPAHLLHSAEISAPSLTSCGQGQNGLALTWYETRLLISRPPAIQSRTPAIQSISVEVKTDPKKFLELALGPVLGTTIATYAPSPSGPRRGTTFIAGEIIIKALAAGSVATVNGLSRMIHATTRAALENPIWSSFSFSIKCKTDHPSSLEDFEFEPPRLRLQQFRANQERIAMTNESEYSYIRGYGEYELVPRLSMSWKTLIEPQALLTFEVNYRWNPSGDPGSFSSFKDVETFWSPMSVRDKKKPLSLVGLIKSKEKGS